MEVQLVHRLTGSIGKNLESCEQLDIVDFQAIESSQINVTEMDLSTDQKYLPRIYQAVSSGSCPSNLIHMSTRKMAHSIM